METVVFTHEYPPIPTRNMDWRAGFDGREEEGRDGWGATKLAAALDLYHQCETIEDTLACIAAILRADLDSGSYGGFASTPGGRTSFRDGFEAAIRTVEGIE